MKRLAIIATIASALSWIATLVMGYIAIWNHSQDWANSACLTFFLALVLSMGTAGIWGGAL